MTAQEPGCWARRARDPESEHKVGDKLLSLGCYPSAFSSLGILCPRPPTRIYTIDLRVTFILVQERTKFLRFDGQLRVDLKRKLGSICLHPHFTDKATEVRASQSSVSGCLQHWKRPRALQPPPVLTLLSQAVSWSSSTAATCV